MPHVARGGGPGPGQQPDRCEDDGNDEELADLDSDRRIRDWTDSLTPEWLAGDAVWNSGAAQQTGTKQRAILEMQLFNHQTHQRGQLHVMLSQQGASMFHTDLSFMPEEAERV